MNPIPSSIAVWHRVLTHFCLVVPFACFVLAAQAQPAAPYSQDANTLVLDHFDGSAAGTISAYRHVAGCGSPAPAVAPNFSYDSGPAGFGPALVLAPPAGEPDGSATYVRYEGQLLGQAGGTIEFWIFLASYGGGASLVTQAPFFGACAGYTFHMIMDANGQLQANAHDFGFNATSGSSRVPLNAWTHLAVAWSSAGTRLYINGEVVGSDANGWGPSPGYGGSVLVRAGSHISGASHRIDELRISNIARVFTNATPPVTLDSIAIVPGNSTVVVGQTVQLRVLGAYSDGSTRDLSGPETLAGGLTRASRIAVDSTDVFWTETAPGNASAKNGSLKRRSKAGGSPATVAANLGWPYGGVVLDADAAYYTDDWDGTVQKVSKRGGPISFLHPGMCCPLGLSADSTALFFTQYRGDLGQGRINRIPLNGGALVNLAGGLTRPTLTRVSDADVYFQDAVILHGCAQAIRTVAKAGGSVETVVTESICMGDGFALDDGYIYWTVAGPGGQVKRMSRSGGSAIAIATNLNNPNTLVIDNAYVYWAARGGGGAGEGAIQAVSLAGGPVLTLAANFSMPFNDLAQDATHIYVTEPGVAPHESNGAVKRVAKPGAVVVWSSSDPSVASISSVGLAVGLKPGATMLTASASELTSSITLHVGEALSLGLRMYSGLSLTGVIGAPYRIEFTPALGNSNAWQTLTNLTLPASPYLFIDYDSGSVPARFYRAVRTQ